MILQAITPTQTANNQRFRGSASSARDFFLVMDSRTARSRKLATTNRAVTFAAEIVDIASTLPGTQLLTWIHVRRPLITCTCWLDARLIPSGVIMLPTLGAVNRIRAQGAC
jgi:hypothetical protein